MVNKFYVYKHVRTDTDEVFYVGKGHGDRAYTKRRRNQYWNRYANKYSWKVEIVKCELSEQDALNLEVQIIAKYKSIGQCVCNLTLGGEGFSGMRHSEKTKKLISSKHLGRKHSKIQIDKFIKSRTGVLHSQQTKDKLSISMSGSNNPMFGTKRTHTDETIKKMSGENNPLSKKVIDLVTGKVYNSVGELCKVVGLNRVTLTAKLNGTRRNNTSFKYIGET